MRPKLYPVCTSTNPLLTLISYSLNGYGKAKRKERKRAEREKGRGRETREREIERGGGGGREGEKEATRIKECANSEALAKSCSQQVESGKTLLPDDFRIVV